MNEFRMTPIDLQAFGEGEGAVPAAAPASDGPAGDHTGSPLREPPAPDASVGAGVPDGPRSPAGDLTGSPLREPPAPDAPVGAGVPDGPRSPADKRAAFRALITGEYRDAYAAETQRLINRRFRETETLRTAAKRAEPLMAALSERYGIAADRPEALADAVRSDVAELLPDDPILTALSERYNIDHGDKAALLSALCRENLTRPGPAAEAALAAHKARAAADFAAARCRGWLAEAAALKRRCPDFDLAAMRRDRVFTTLLAGGLPVEAAWRAADAEGTARRAAQAARKALAEQIRAGRARPTEAGAAAQAAFAVKADPARFSDGQVRDVLARLDRRERVSFG